jgi:cytochrome c
MKKFIVERKLPGAGNMTDEDAQQLAVFINSKPRPVYPTKDRDYRTEQLPPDAVYYGQR